MPYSSQNPSIAKLAEGLPSIKILSKSDLADPKVTRLWQAHFEQSDSVKTLLTTLEQTDKGQRLLSLCHKLIPNKPKGRLNILAMITGIPNVGKSTLINAVARRMVAKTGNEPAITKGLQKIRINDGMVFLDTPGILWPKIHNENSGYRLAASGAIKDTATEVEDIAMYLADFLLKNYPQALTDRYGINDLPDTEFEFLELLGARRGALRAGGYVDLERVSTILVNEFRSGKLGGITLETPEIVLAEEIIVAQKQREKAEKDAQKKKKKRKSRNR